MIDSDEAGDRQARAKKKKEDVRNKHDIRKGHT